MRNDKLFFAIAVIALVLLLSLTNGIARAEAIASMPNQAGGKIVLTNEICKFEGKTYSSLYKIYYYTSEGYTDEGCYGLEDETVIALWKSGKKMRYPAESFTLLKKSKGYQL